eukprot:TRINITY_DN1039_c0_g1_i1.p3 TRINITY_DN1039_c0_g1~~TRINITY_DN1039_c0_g1_i1.p3  ORF type:complete len:215 (-),score=42.01 TRINITY_DN1039_c0_g1_i1:65-709(-)
MFRRLCQSAVQRPCARTALTLEQLVLKQPTPGVPSPGKWLNCAQRGPYQNYLRSLININMQRGRRSRFVSKLGDTSRELLHLYRLSPYNAIFQTYEKYRPLISVTKPVVKTAAIPRPLRAEEQISIVSRWIRREADKLQWAQWETFDRKRTALGKVISDAVTTDRSPLAALRKETHAKAYEMRRNMAQGKGKEKRMLRKVKGLARRQIMLDIRG